MLARIVIYRDGSIGFFNENGDYHRIDGWHACEWYDGSKYWVANGKYHRLDGPACEYPDGDKQWWIKGKRYSEEEFKKIVGEIC